MIYYTNEINPAIPENASKAIKGYINDFIGSNEYIMYAIGEAYYTSRNLSIMSRKKMVFEPQYTLVDDVRTYSHGEAITDPYRSNYKLPSAFSKILTDQKLNYLIGNNINFGDNNEEIYERLGKRTPKKFKQIAKCASKKSIGWAYIYDNKGQFSFNVMNPAEIIPIYKLDQPEELEVIIRFFSKWLTDENGEKGELIRVEVWDAENVTLYQEIKKGGNYRLCSEDEMLAEYGKALANPHSHFVETIKEGTTKTVSDSGGWGEVPFVQMYNNDEQLYDLSPIRHYIDAYDFISSDGANNLEEATEFYWILKGYSGENTKEFLDDVRRYKLLQVDGDGSAEAKTVELPYLARETFLKGIRASIYDAGMGMDTTAITGSSLTNVAIQAAEQNLALKVKGFEDEVTDFIDKLLWFMNEHAKRNNKDELDYKVIYTYSRITNEKESLEAVTSQNGIVSRETLYNNHPWVDNSSDEIKRKEAEDMSNFDTGEVNGNNE